MRIFVLNQRKHNSMCHLNRLIAPTHADIFIYVSANKKFASIAISLKFNFFDFSIGRCFALPLLLLRIRLRNVNRVFKNKCMFKAGEQQMTAMSRNKELKFHEAKLESISRRLHSIRAMTNVGQVGFWYW